MFLKKIKGLKSNLRSKNVEILPLLCLNGSCVVVPASDLNGVEFVGGFGVVSEFLAAVRVLPNVCVIRLQGCLCGFCDGLCVSVLCSAGSDSYKVVLLERCAFTVFWFNCFCDPTGWIRDLTMVCGFESVMFEWGCEFGDV